MPIFFPTFRNVSGRVHIGVLVTAVLTIAVAVWLLRTSSATYQIPRKQEALLTAIEKRSRARVERLIADDYLDRWQFDKEDAVLSLLDVGSQFFVIAVQSIDPVLRVEEGDATVTTRLKIAGNGGPVAQLVIRRTNRLDTPFAFHWRKQSWWPGSWRLVRVDNEELPDDLEGYEPGAIRRAMSGN